MGMAGPGGGADQEQARSADPAEYLRRMRSLPVDQVIKDVLFTLLNAAQVKLGRRDARLLIDISAVAHEHARPYLPGELSREIDQVLGQLRMGQVTAEGRQAQQPEPAENDLPARPASPPADASP